jgi:predicted secreted protein
MATPIKGETGILYIHDGTIYRPVACLTSTGFNPSVSIIESNTKCNPGVTTKQAGIFTYSLSGEGQYIDTTSVGGDITKASHDFLFTKMVAKLPVTWKLDTGVTGIIYYGSAIITDLPLDQGSGDDLSTFSITLEGSGSVATVDPKAALTPVMTSASAVNITAGTARTFQVTATNSPTSYGITGSIALPSGVTLNTTTGLITATTGAAVGVTVVSLQIFNSEGWSTNSVTINVTA